MDSQVPTSPWHTSASLGFSWECVPELRGGQQMDQMTCGSVRGQSQHDLLTLSIVWEMKDAQAPQENQSQGRRSLSSEQQQLPAE